jgi:hypothetical protein
LDAPSFYHLPKILDAPSFYHLPKILDAPSFYHPPKILDGPSFYHPPKILKAPIFCIYFAAPIFLYIFLHFYLVFANNLIGANVLRFLG